ncbi:hypothetical protein HN446_02350 [bacterium]|jgi:hypothetical protein|nr:hypothetical protein [bacterium]
MIGFATAFGLISISVIFIGLKFFKEQGFFNILRIILVSTFIAALIPMINYWAVQSWQTKPQRFSNLTNYPELNKLYDEWKNESKQIDGWLNTGNYKNVSQRESDTRQKYEDELKKHEQNHDKAFFTISSIIGTSAILIGVALQTIVLTPAYVVGGIVCLSMGYYKYWDRIAAGARFFSFLILLILVIGLGYKFSKKEDLF